MVAIDIADLFSAVALAHRVYEIGWTDVHDASEYIVLNSSSR
jgi:hypothetical protein